MADTFLTPKEAAERLRSSVATLARWRVNGTGPAYVKTGQKVLYRPEILDAFMNANTRTKTRDGA